MATWNLETLYKQKEEKQLIEQLQEKVTQFKQHKGKLDKITPDKFLEILKEKEQIIEILQKLGAKAELKLTENTSDQKATTHHSKISQLSADIDNELIFFSLWFKDLTDEEAKKYIENSGKYKYYLERIRAFKHHTLKEQEEKIITLKDLTGNETLTKLYDVITNAYTFEFEGKQLGQEEINQYKQNANREKRKAAYDLVLSRYGKEENVLGEIYKAIVMDWKNENITLRKFKTPISVQNLANDLPDKTVEVLLKVVRKNVKLFQEYFKLKAKICKTKIDRYDLYMPYSTEEKEYNYETSKKIVLDTYKQFGEEAYDYAKKIFDAQHVHSEITPGKRSGAFCYTASKDILPYVMLNHVDRLNNLFTMMHEFGHGIHGAASHEQTQYTYHSCLPLAETASIFGEMLLSQRLLNEATKQEKIAVLLRNLDSQYASIIRQAYFILFEIEAHEKIPNTTTEELNKIYLENLKEQFGDSMHVPEVFQYEWMYIPHIYHSPFYCYAYTFGNLLVLSLYDMYEKQGKEFVPKYMKLLAAGGSESPQKVLKEIGIDVNSETFWQQGFNIIKEEIELLKKLIQ